MTILVLATLLELATLGAPAANASPPGSGNDLSPPIAPLLQALPSMQGPGTPAPGCDPECPSSPELRLKIRWSGRKHAFLQNPVIHIRTWRGPLASASPAEKSFKFAPPDADTQELTAPLALGSGIEPLHVEWSVSFQPTVRLVGMKAAKKSEVLSAGRRYAVTRVSAPCGPARFAAEADAEGALSHPLVTESFDAGSATITARLETGFVDLTELWSGAVQGVDREQERVGKIWDQADPGHARLRVLGNTHGNPALWTAYLPPAAAEGGESAPLSRIVLYTHEISFYDTPVIGLGNPAHTQWYANKYLLSGCVNPPDPKKATLAERCAYVFDQYGALLNWLPSGLGPALEATGKRAVILTPWRRVSKETVIGNTDMPADTEKMMKILQAEKRIPPGENKATGPLVIAAYSGGGSELLPSFMKYHAKISGVWAFDPVINVPGEKGVLTEAHQKELAAWLTEDPSRQFKLVSSMHEDEWKAFWERMKKAGVQPGQLTHETVGGTPASMRWFRAQGPGNLGWFADHQFTLNGGEQSESGARKAYFSEFAESLP